MSTLVADTLDRLLDPVGRSLSSDAARKLVNLRADGPFQTRLDELADKNTADQLTAEERQEYDLYLSAISVLTVLQSKARLLQKDGS